MQINKKQGIRIGVAGGLAVIVGIGIAALVWGGNTVPPVPAKTYENTDLQIAFSYPGAYTLKETIASSTEFTHNIFLFEHADTLHDSSSTDASTAVSIEQSPDTIAIEVFGRGGEIDIAEWVQNNATTSHFSLSNNTFESASVANKKIISYQWDGDVEGNTLALIHNGRVFLLTVAYTEDSETIQENFISLLSTMEFM